MIFFKAARRPSPCIVVVKTLVFMFAFFLSVQNIQTAAAQQTGMDRDVQTEQSYSPDMANLILITEQSRSSELALKNNALALIARLLAQDKKNPEILDALEFLALEGVVNKKRVNGRITNNYPNIRAKAATCLGDYGGEDAKKILVRMLKAEADVMVLVPALYALSKIGVTAEDEITLNDMMRRLDAPRPDNLLAIAYLDALEKYSEEQSGVINLATRHSISNISRGAYTKLVQKKASLLLEKLNSYRGR
ncbi:MAG: HEAT repeat domain-containing protein [Treponema sp.]|nr:HEAT repeat domain-containing protein [Treponema sp.]